MFSQKWPGTRLFTFIFILKIKSPLFGRIFFSQCEASPSRVRLTVGYVAACAFKLVRASSFRKLPFRHKVRFKTTIKKNDPPRFQSPARA